MSEQTSWLDLTPEAFNTQVKQVQGTLFAEPDRYGTPDMFDGE